MDSKTYIEETEKQLKQWSEAMDRIQTKADKAGDEIKQKCFEHIKVFRETDALAWDHLAALKNATEADQEKIKNDIESATGQLKKAIEDATALFS